MNDIRPYLPPPEQVDLLVVFAHPDDEVCWFGGLIPEMVAQGRSVLGVCMTRGEGGGRAAERDAELRASLWTCGVRYEPVWGGFPDCGFIAPGRFESLEWVHERWGGRKAATEYLAGCYRRFQPRVIVTHHPETGDYGHPNHMASGWACVDAFDLCQRQDFAGLRSTAIQKLYVCGSDADPDAGRGAWDLPLAAFGGETAIAVGNRALRCHRSQSASEGSGIRSTLAFSLRRSRVGEDPMKRDLFENTRQ